MTIERHDIAGTEDDGQGMQTMNGGEARRLYEVSRECYAPVLAAFASEWLGELAQQPDGIALCLARDGLAPFLAARTLMRVHSRRFRDIHSRRVRLAFVSRPLAQAAAADPRQADLLDRYLRRQGMAEASPLTLVDIGIHGSIQDCLQRLYPRRAVSGRYLVLRRRSGDINGAQKRGFLADLDVAPRRLAVESLAIESLAIEPASLPEPAWNPGGRLRRGHSLFLHPRSLYVLEDLWNGVGETAQGLEASAGDQTVVVVRRPAEPQMLTLPPASTINAKQRAALKRAALRGIVDGVAASGPDDVPPGDAAQGLASWLGGLDHPTNADAHILRMLVRQKRGQRRPGAEAEDTDLDDIDGT